MTTNGRPSKVKEVMDFWTQPPPELSDRCKWWIRQFENGWTPNRRWCGSQGYHLTAEMYGVYIWEYLNVISPLIRKCEAS